MSSISRTATPVAGLDSALVNKQGSAGIMANIAKSMSLSVVIIDLEMAAERFTPGNEPSVRLLGQIYISPKPASK